VDITLS